MCGRGHDTFHIYLLWPQNRNIPVVRLQIHAPCLLEDGKSHWCYDVNINMNTNTNKEGANMNDVSADYFCRELDSNNRTNGMIQKCIICLYKEDFFMF